MGSLQRVSRALGGASLAMVTAGGLTVVTALASGYGQGNFDAGGGSVNQIGVVNGSLSGYNPAPAAYNTSGGPATFGYDFTVNRYTGPNHVPAAQTIDLTLNLRVNHIVSIAGSGDSNANVAVGDPSAAGSNPPFTEAYLLAHASALGEVVVSSVPFTVHLDPNVASQAFTFTASVPNCGYYEVDTGTTDKAAAHLNDFSSLTSGYIRATGCGGGSGSPSPAATATPTPTSSVQGITSPPTSSPSASPAVASAVQGITTPDTGAVDQVDGTLAAGLLLMGAGLVTGAIGNRTRRYTV